MKGLLGSLFNLYWFTLPFPILTQIGKNIVTDRALKKQGYKITYNDDILENIIDFIKDYSYIFIPVINIKMALELLSIDKKEYTKKRIKKLTNRNRITKQEKTEPKKEEKPVKKEEPVKQETKKPEVIQIKENKQTKKEDLIKPFVEEIQNSSDINFLEQLKKEYRRRSVELRPRYAKLLEKYNISTNKETRKELRKELNSIASNINIYDKIFTCAKARIVELKTQQNQKIK